MSLKLRSASLIFCQPRSGITFASSLTGKVVNLVKYRFPEPQSGVQPAISTSPAFHFSSYSSSLSRTFKRSVAIQKTISDRNSLRYYSKMSSKPILYSYFRSSASWRVRILLAHKGIDYEYRAVNLLKKEHVGEEYMKICPMGQVPSLLYDGTIITQSLAIMEFLEDLYPEVPMIPKKNPTLKAKVLEICEIVNTGIQPLQNLSVIMKVSPEDAEKRLEWAAFWITKGLTALEKVLSKSGGKFCVGDEVTWADACFFPQAASAGRFKVELEQWPTVNRIYKELGELEAFKKAHAFAQPDCPPELKAQGKLS